MEIYRTKVVRLTGTDYHEIVRKAERTYKDIVSKTRRKPYIRSAYFKKEKVFLDYFWQHIQDKNWRDRVRRLQFYPCALDLIKNSRLCYESKFNPNNYSEMFYKFKGATQNKEIFIVQVKENIKRGEKYFLSVFPE